MSERSTGATDSQIEAAENRCEEGGQFNAVWIEDLAGYLVPPGFAIVPVSPVTDPALVEAALEFVELVSAVFALARRAPEARGSNRFAIDEAARSLNDLRTALRAAPEPERAE